MDKTINPCFGQQILSVVDHFALNQGSGLAIVDDNVWDHDKRTSGG